MAQEFKIGRLRFTWKGAWTAATTYSRDDIVSYQGKTYVCLIANTSDATNFYNDLNYITGSGASTPYWNLIIDGKTFTGQWSTGTAYSLGNIAIFGGQIYYCTTQHTSTTFASQSTYWALYTQFPNWHITWTTNTSYGIGDVVKYGGIVYSCIANHTSAATTALGLESNQAAWKVFYSGINYTGIWIATTRYKLNDLAKLGDNIYQCTTYNSDSVFVPANWSLWLPGLEYAPSNPWVTNSNYQLGDTIEYGGYTYISKITNNLGNIPSTSPSAWSLFTQGFAFLGEWSAATNYIVGDIVRRHGRLYSTNTNHISQDPSALNLSSTYIPNGSSGTTLIVGSVAGITPGMNVLGPGFTQGQTVSSAGTTNAQFTGTFSVTGTTLTVSGVTGTIVPGMVLSGGTIGPGTYIVSGAGLTWTVSSSQAANTTCTTGTLNTVILSSPPDSTATLTTGQGINFIGVNYVYWNLLIPGTYWTKTWVSTTYYTVGDIAVWQNGTYICVQGHTANSSNRPDLDTNNLYWVFYVTHARKNAMNTSGDLEYYSSSTSSYTSLPISGTQGQVQNSYVLRSTNNIPSWTKINSVPNVYYVCSSTGQNIATYGSTWDQPWRTIAYACNFIANGTQNPNTVALIQANKAWMLAEMIQWTNYQINTPAASYNYLYSGYSLNTTKATRDAGFIIDAIAYDLGRGGNSQTVAAAQSFFAFGQNNIFYSSVVAADVPYYLPMLNYLTTLLNFAITQTNTTNYQITNQVTPVINQTTGLLAAESAGATSASTLISYVTTALSTQSTYSLPPTNTGISITIFVKTGTYSETLPISVPENVAIVGDELRGVIVQPAISIVTTATASNSSTNLFTVSNISALTDQMPVMFAASNILNVIGTTYVGFGGITTGQKYYAVGSTINTTTNQFAITSSTGTYTYVTATNTSSSGVNATFTVSPASTGTYNVSASYAGSGYAVSDTLKILGGNVGATTFAATSLVQGTVYTILTVGTTTFTAAGASSNTVGTSFTYNGTTLTGTGTVNLSVNDINITVTGITAGGITSVSSTGSTIVPLTSFSGGNMTVYAGDSLKDMFRLRNGTGLRNMTLTGLVGTLGAIDSYLIQRPTGGSYACLDPGTNPNDTTAWIFRRSPYVQNVTAFGNGCTALKIDGTLHNGGNKSIVCNDFTHIVNDGIGIWCTGPGALTEAVSVFSYYGYSGYMAEAGGRIRATNGNSSYGVYGVIATGYDITEIPATGSIFNQSSQVQATVQSSFGSSAQLLRLSYSNAGSAYYTPTTNWLNYSNNFLGSNWTSDGNLVFSKNTIALTGNVEAWTLQGLTSGPDGSYVYQNIPIPAAGATYTNVSAVNVSGSGIGATFNITVTSTNYTVVVNAGGSGYVSGNQMFIAGGQLGGVNSVNDCIITVGSTGALATILTVTSTGTVPANSALNYTLSLYVKQGNATSIDLYGIFNGSNSVTSSINFNFITGVVTPRNSAISGSSAGLLPINYGAINQTVSTTGNTTGWYRIWLSVNDTTGLNTNLQFRIYPKGYNGTAGQYSYIYGSQVELSSASYTPNFYLEVASTSKYTAYANLNISGSGTGVVTIADEIRSASVFQTRVATDSNGTTGGAGYLTASNNAQSGSAQFVQLSVADTNTNANYTGMRVFIQSGTGAGQYGYISYFDSRTTGGTPKYAWVLKESFTSLQIASTNQGTGFFTLANSNVGTLYLNQPVQFIPTYYTTVVTSTNLSQTTVTAALGGTSNYFTVASTLGITVNMGITFTAGSGAIFSNVIAGYTYYVSAILSSTTIQISSSYAGTVYQLNTVSSGTMVLNFIANNNYLQANTTNMVVNYPIQYTGITLGGLTDSTVYYINDIIDSNNFTLSTTLVTVTVTTTSSGTNYLTTGSGTTTASLVQLNPIVFTNTIFDTVVDSQKYYISSIVNSTQFTIASSLIAVSMTATANATNLITVTSTAGFVVNQPINFIGTTWEINIQSGAVYYIQAINNITTFTISQTPGGGAVVMNGGSGQMLARTCPAPFSLNGSSGSMIGTSTNTVKTLTLSPSGSMTATFSTSLFGNVTIGQTYYVQSIPSSTGTTFAVSLNQGTVSGTSTSATPFGILTKTGSMNVASVGWDHINPGTPIQSVLDNTSVYYIEPRLTYTAPIFSQTNFISAVQLTGGTLWTSMAYSNRSNYWIAFPSTGQTAAGSSDGQTWTSLALPLSQSWTGIAYGNGYWIAIASGSQTIIVSKANGLGWRTSSLTSSTTWSNIAYGNGVFVAIASGTSTAAYSNNYGQTWTSCQTAVTLTATSFTVSAGTATIGFTNTTGIAPFTVGSTITLSGFNPTTTTGPTNNINTTFTVATCTTSQVTFTLTGTYSSSILGTVFGTHAGLPTSSNWSSITYGNGLFVAIASGSSAAAYSLNGQTWYISTLPSSSNWSSITYGQQTFVAVSSSSGGSVTTPAYTQNGYTWYSSNIAVTSTSVVYGQGVFTALNSGSTTAYTSEDCLQWNIQGVAGSAYANNVAFGFGTNNYGLIATLTSTSSGSIISAGCRTKGRPSVTSGVITSVNEWEPGSGYVTSAGATTYNTPAVTVTDPNITTNVLFVQRLSQGVLSSPTFNNKGNGYNSNSTVILVTGSGYADQYQTGLTVILNNLTRLPSPGDNLTITGVSQIYKVTSAYPVFGTIAPNLEANISVSPAIIPANSTANGTIISIRTKYSQARLTNHDFLYIGSGDLTNSLYPATSSANSQSNNQTVEANYGRVFYTSTDQDGNFKVGSLFGVQQATGIVTLSASQFGISGLNSLSLGGISVGGSGVIITQFSTDGTFSANSDSVIATQKSIKTYLTSRLSQGGSNTFTGQLTAGTVVVGSPNLIKSTIPNGTTGSNVKMTSKVYFGQVLNAGPVNIGVDGNLAALYFFARNSWYKTV